MTLTLLSWVAGLLLFSTFVFGLPVPTTVSEQVDQRGCGLKEARSFLIHFPRRLYRLDLMMYVHGDDFTMSCLFYLLQRLSFILRSHLKLRFFSNQHQHHLRRIHQAAALYQLLVTSSCLNSPAYFAS